MWYSIRKKINQYVISEWVLPQLSILVVLPHHVSNLVFVLHGILHGVALTFVRSDICTCKGVVNNLIGAKRALRFDNSF